jgi:hypothetical protein
MARQTITITLYKSELIYDVQNKTYLTGRSRQTGGNHEEVANMQANDDDENANQILRSLGNAFATLKTKLSEYLEESGTSANDILMNADGNIVIALKVPSNFNPAANGTVSAALHQYIVNTAIGDWFTITNKNDAADYIALAGANLEQIREAVNKRVRPQRPTPEEHHLFETIHSGSEMGSYVFFTTDQLIASENTPKSGDFIATTTRTSWWKINSVLIGTLRCVVSSAEEAEEAGIDINA